MKTRFPAAMVLAITLAVGIGIWLRGRGDSGSPNFSAAKDRNESRRSGEHARSTFLSRDRGSSNAWTSPGVEKIEADGARLARWMEGDKPDEARLSLAQLDHHIANNQTNAASLLAAFEGSNNLEFLKRAAALNPGDSQVQAKVLLHNAFPEQRKEWIEAFKKSSPENAFPHLLAAQEKILSGDTAAAMAEIEAARGKRFNDFSRETSVGLEDAYLAAGRSIAEAKLMGSAEILLPHLNGLRSIATNLVAHAVERRSANDIEAQNRALSAVWELGSHLRYSPGQPILITDLIGVVIQNMGLKEMDPRSPVPWTATGLTAADQLARNEEYRSEVKKNTALIGQWLPQASETEIIAYFDRSRLLGEVEAMKWVQQRNYSPLP